MNQKNIHKLALGTVQFGLPYGIANQAGQVQIEEAEKILNTARNAGITDIDTAIAYGESETVLGRIGVNWANVTTKLPPLPDDVKDVSAWVIENIEQSLKRQNITRFKAIMLHRAHDLSSIHGDQLYKSLEALKTQKLTAQIGYSIYSPKDLDSFFSNYPADIIQAPFNVIDRRLERSGWMEKLKSENVEVQVRSVFLQGLLLMETENIPAGLKKWRPLLLEFQNWAKEQNRSPLEAALGYVYTHPKVDQLVFGVDSNRQLLDILNQLNDNTAVPPESLISNDEQLINPAQWNKT